MPDAADEDLGLDGVYVTLFVKAGESRKALRAAQQEDRRLYERPVNQVVNAKVFRPVPVDIDDAPPDFVEETHALQWIYMCSTIEDYVAARDKALAVARHVVRKLGTDCVYGVHLLLCGQEQTITAILTRMDAYPVPISVGNMTLYLIEAASIKAELSDSLSALSWVGPADIAETTDLLAGVAGELILPELTNHKVKGLARHVLSDDERKETTKLSKQATDLVNDTTRGIINAAGLRESVRQATQQTAELARRKSVVGDILADLEVQRHHLMYHRSRGMVVKLYDIYVRHVDATIAGVQALYRQLSIARNSLKDVFLLAQGVLVEEDAKMSASQEERNRRFDFWITMLGVGIACAELYSDNVAGAVLQRFFGKPCNENTLLWQTGVLGIRASLSVLTGLAAWYIAKRYLRKPTT